LPESRTPRPHNLYACAKLLAESFCGLYRDQFSIVVTRPFNAIGRGHRETFLVPKLVRHFRERRPEIELGNTDVARDYTDVRDLAAMYALLLEAKSPHECLNLCNGVAVSIATLIERLSAITGHSIRKLVNPSFVRQNDVTYACGATDRLRTLGFQWKHSLDATLEWMVTETAEGVS
jgi:nucleoside-diphosphate-sugar epimerase